jgi:bifunctional UDP-N-acetylglucosamine pyrophosphorylase/glucosamine-1-phosphate N-acetyltransferase
MVLTIILAAGLQFNPLTKMPSLLDTINKKPRLLYHIKQALSIHSSHILIVVGKYRNIIEPMIKPYIIGMSQIHYIDQPEDIHMNATKVRGTGDAIKCCMPFLLKNQILFETNILIIHGNGSLLNSKVIYQLMRVPNTILVAKMNNPSSYGRIILNSDNTIAKIVEDKECTEEEKQIKMVNYGFYNIQLGVLNKFIPALTNKNKCNEYYLTDIVEIASKNFVSMIPCEL